MKAFKRYRFWIPLEIMVLFFMSCSAMPVIKPAAPAALADIEKQCQRPFPPVPYRFVHAIEATFPDGSQGTFLGVTVAEPVTGTLHSVLLTLEGLVLFDGRKGKDGVFTNRALPPFNRGSVAGRLMEDVSLLFLPPGGRIAAAGVLEDGSAICRYGRSEHNTEDVIIHRDATWELGTYRDGYLRLRTVRASDIRNGTPNLLELFGYAEIDYVLRLTLISAEVVGPGEMPE